MTLDIFNRKNLIGDQSIDTINNFNEYLDSLLNPFNDQLTQLSFELDDIKIQKPFTYTISLVNELQIKNSILLDKYTLIDNSAQITVDCNDYIAELNTSKTTFTNIYNSKALKATPLTRPVLTTIINNNNSAITKAYASNRLLEYSIPMPVPNTKLYVNKNSTAYMWA